MLEWAVLLLVALLILLVVSYLQFRWRHRRILSAATQLPCPPKWPLLGNAHYFTGGITNMTRLIVQFTTQFKGIFCLWVGPVPVFVVSNPIDVQTILNSSNTLEKDVTYDFLKPFLGNGLLTAPVPVWKKYRRLLTPVLHPSNVELFFPDFNEVSKQLCKEVGCGAPVDPREGIFSASVDSVMRTVISRRSIDCTTKKNFQFLLNRVGRLFTYRLFKVWLHFDWLFNFIYRKELKQIFETLSACVAVFDQEWQDEEIKRKEVQVKIAPQLDGITKQNILDVAWKNPPNDLEDHEWSHEIFTMIVGATDTVVAAVSFLLVTLASHPEAQAKVRAEINEVLGDSSGDVIASDLNAMHYLGSALMEAMRLHGIFPVILRRATKDTKLTSCTLPSGSRILVALHAMGWNPETFPEPYKFQPERFLKNEADKTPNSFLPFSGGPRNCPGKMYAMLFMKTIVVHLLRRYHLTSPVTLDDIEYELKVIMFSKTPLPICFEPI